MEEGGGEGGGGDWVVISCFDNTISYPDPRVKRYYKFWLISNEWFILGLSVLR